jgi:hypothetical protein
MVKVLLMDDFGDHKISVAAMSFGALYCIANMIVLCDITSLPCEHAPHTRSWARPARIHRGKKIHV